MSKKNTNMGTKCPMTSLTHLFPRTLSSAHSGDILQILLEPCSFSIFWLCCFLCTFYPCFVVLYLFIRLAFTIALASWFLPVCSCLSIKQLEKRLEKLMNEEKGKSIKLPPHPVELGNVKKHKCGYRG